MASKVWKIAWHTGVLKLVGGGIEHRKELEEWLRVVYRDDPYDEFAVAAGDAARLANLLNWREEGKVVSDETVYYVAQEMAMAPGIVKDWPNIIKHPTDRNGRLKRLSVSPEAQRKEDAERVLGWLRRVEWIGDGRDVDDTDECYVCAEWRCEGHAPGCELAAEIAYWERVLV